MSRLMKIRLSVPLSNIPLQLVERTANDSYCQSQTVKFVNVFGIYTPLYKKPEEEEYASASKTSAVLLDYVYYQQLSTEEPRQTILEIQNYQGWAPIRTAGVASELLITVFKQEVSYDVLGNLKECTIYYPVNTSVTNFHFKDYNVSNNRFYKYILYPSNKDLPLMAVEKTVKTKWQGWSITELHPVDSSMKKFTTSSEDVWVFNSNVETGEQQQSIVMNEQQTLGTYPRYSLAKQNYLVSNVSCLLGDVLPAEYILRKRKEKEKNENGDYVIRTYEDLIYSGGYTEVLPFSKKISSNDRVDMLKAWRKLVYSGNPKLLKDRKGQSFLVSITANSNKPNDNVGIQPDVISFSWSQIGTTEGVQIVDSSFKGGGT